MALWTSWPYGHLVALRTSPSFILVVLRTSPPTDLATLVADGPHHPGGPLVILVAPRISNSLWSSSLSSLTSHADADDRATFILLEIPL
jgi:hypothetical protein